LRRLLRQANRGEAEAICLAVQAGAGVLLVDNKKGRRLFECQSRPLRRIGPWFSVCHMSTAELIFDKAKMLPESAQTAVLEIVELLGKQAPVEPTAVIQPGSAKGLITAADDFDQPLPDLEPYME
jgi:hypothetical protein